MIKTDNNKYELSETFKRDHTGGTIWEWADIQVDNSTLIMLNDMVESKKTKIRYIGSDYKSDRDMTEKERKIIKETLQTYKTFIE